MNDHVPRTPAAVTNSAATSRLLTGRRVESLATAQADRNLGDGLRIAREMSPGEVIDLVDRSGLRGRGGAGFPTGRKWRTVASFASAVAPTSVVVNAAEGEPGTFKDRAILNENPYEVLEGALIAAHAIGAVEVLVVTKVAFAHERRRLDAAIAEITAAGWLGGATIRVVDGPGEYLFGEETALLEVIEGRPPFPRVAPPFRRGIDPQQRRTGHSAAGASFAEEGGDEFAPVLMDNVETIANLPGIVRNGVEWFRSAGTSTSPGTIVCTVTGSTLRHGVGEFAMGTPLRHVIDVLGGGVADGRTIAAVLCGVSGPPVPPAALDTQLTYESMAAAGLGLGSASFIVVDDSVPLVRLAGAVAHFLGIESCGQCEPCKRDALALDTLLGASSVDRKQVESRLSTVNEGARCALAGQTERVVAAILDLASQQTDAGPWDPEVMSIVPLVEIVGGRAVLDLAALDKRPDWSFPEDGIESGAWPAQHLADQPVTIRPPHTPEPSTRADAAEHSTTTADPSLAPLLRSHDRLEVELATLRAAPPAGVAAALESLDAELRRHLDVAERYLYPLMTRVRPDIGDEIVRYPDRHERNAQRLVDRLRTDPRAVAPRLIDDIAVDVHRTILELERRVLPELQRQLASAQSDRLLNAELTELE